LIEACRWQNFGPLADLSWDELGPINLVIGANGCGKTFVLKSLYVAMRTLELHGRGQEPRSAAQILAEKLYWTFQPERIGDLVSKGSQEPLSFDAQIDGDRFAYSFGSSTKLQIQAPEITNKPRQSNSVFLPAKEVLSLHHLILQSRERDQLFGFDDTYYDLALALRHGTKQGKNFTEFAASREQLKALLGGKVSYEEDSGEWIYEKGNQRFAIGVAAEGIKKIGILDTLLGNRSLGLNSVVFIDEPESALHPHAISTYLEIIASLAMRGIQFFLSSHSYFVVKNLHLIAKGNSLSIPVLSGEVQGWRTDNMLNGMPDNPVINEVGALYRQEIDLL
jgi:energy-coupling factor transporter ATP-binding protein EcfA2